MEANYIVWQTVAHLGMLSLKCWNALFFLLQTKKNWRCGLKICFLDQGNVKNSDFSDQCEACLVPQNCEFAKLDL